jgi:SET domain-containing protein
VRLGVSEVHGIGVFAIRPISEGTKIFPNDSQPIRWVDVETLDQSRPDESARRFYDEFGIRQGGRIGCPRTFENLTPGWYLNEPPEGGRANVRADPDFSFFASRDIKEGEELLIDYASFSEPPD